MAVVFKNNYVVQESEYLTYPSFKLQHITAEPPHVLPDKPAVHPETTTRIKPSEAIKLGRLLRPNVIARFYVDSKDGACTLGAMALGFGLNPTRRDGGGVSDYLARYFPEMPQYVRDKIRTIPTLMDKQTYADLFGNKPKNPKDIEAEFIRALEAMGY